MVAGYKRIIILCDGTWQSRTQALVRGIKSQLFTQYLDNVALLSQAIKPVGDDGVEQIVFYQDGVGTGIGLISNIVAGATGSGLTANMIEAYSFLVDNYKEGDEIFLFGYSRGAFTARALSGFILWAGILSKAQLSFIQPIFDAYRLRAPGKPDLTEYAARVLFYFTGRWPSRESMAVEDVAEGALREKKEKKKKKSSEGWKARRAVREQRGPCVEPPRIKFIGVMDTVGALGIPGSFQSMWARNKFAFFDTGLSSNVEIAYQALALSENRKDFTPTLWDRFDPSTGQKMTQVWFVGAHANIGGGLEYHGLSDVVLANLCAQLTDNPEGPLLSLDLDYVRAVQDRTKAWGRAEPRRSRHWFEFRKEREVCRTLALKEHQSQQQQHNKSLLGVGGGACSAVHGSDGNSCGYDTDVERGMVAERTPQWANEVPSGPNREMLHHSVVVSGRFDVGRSEQFGALRGYDPDVLRALWAHASDPGSMLPTERALMWTQPHDSGDDGADSDADSDGAAAGGQDGRPPPLGTTWARPPANLSVAGVERYLLVQDALLYAAQGVGVWVDVATWPGVRVLNAVVTRSLAADANLVGKPVREPGRVSARYFRLSGRAWAAAWAVGRKRAAETAAAAMLVPAAAAA